MAYNNVYRVKFWQGVCFVSHSICSDCLVFVMFPSNTCVFRKSLGGEIYIPRSVRLY